MMRAHFLHGFNVWDGGEKTIRTFAPAFRAAGLSVHMHDYGWTGPLALRLRNAQVVRHLHERIQPGDVIVGHSNACLIAWQLADEGAPLSTVVCVQPALRRDALWPDDLNVICMWNPHDIAVHFGRMWGRFATRATGRAHGWGAAGAYGFTDGQPNVHNWNVSAPSGYYARGHSGVFADARAAGYWSTRAASAALLFAAG